MKNQVHVSLKGPPLPPPLPPLISCNENLFPFGLKVRKQRLFGYESLLIFLQIRCADNCRGCSAQIAVRAVRVRCNPSHNSEGLGRDGRQHRLTLTLVIAQ